MLGQFIFSIVILVATVAYIAHLIKREKQRTRRFVLAAAHERNEALFRSLFPELQPHYHPARLIHFVRARRSRKAGSGTWANPPGFDAASAETSQEDGQERVRLRDASGALLSDFVFEPLPEGGVLRVGKGKFTVDIQDAAHPRVRYWHPEREFKWKREQWTFQSRIAERSLESGQRTGFASGASSKPGAGRARVGAAGVDFDAPMDHLRSGTSY